MTARTTDLTVTGMTCGACVSRVEKRLGRIDGVSAAVNLATGQARITHPASVTAEDLLGAVEQAGYRGRLLRRTPEEAPADDPADRRARERVLVLTALTVPVLALSMAPGLQFRYWQWLGLALAAPVATWGTWPFHRRAAAGLRHATATMDTLVSLGVLASFGWSLYALFLGGAGAPGMRMPFAWTATPDGASAHLYLEAATGVTLFVSVGRYLEARARRRTGSALAALSALVPEKADLRDGRRIPVGDLRPGQHFIVRPGQTIATDGVIVEGGSALDTRLLTGEAVPAECGPGDTVTGGATNVGGALVIRATAVGADTRLAKITALVEEAQLGKARAQRRADQIAGIFVPMVLAIAVTALGFWLGAGADPGAALSTGIAVLVVACPCALGLATPLALLAATGAGARRGVLISGPDALERLGRIDTVVLDKTGTLTTGRMSLLATATVPGVSEVEALRPAGALEDRSEHPIGRAIAHAARSRGPLPAVAGFRATPGHGVSGQVDGRAISVGRWNGDRLPGPLRAAIDQADRDGHTSVLLRADDRPVAVLTLGDTLRDGARETITRLHRMGLRTVLATGDRPAAARAVAERLGITDRHAELAPAAKAEIVDDLRAQGRVVAVAGDGVNDTVALARADLGIAVADGTDAAIGAADVTLMRPDVSAIADAIAIARRANMTIKVNLAWAFAYNLITIPPAALGRLNPMLAAAAMSLSSLLVAANSLRLLRGRRR
ncbi:heavy metal translocating P-type ATPase [Actinoallomurus sp. CA-150999]|uniref:heavy metal translocating P-type ATPase n=1 Tax=Actinoallomurus sp. CA-150999 TaxID=3239887 RepID=UPI003D93984A